MKSQLYIITAKTHLHAGSGNSNAGVIDNLVQRDPTDNLPCIYASSLKGAFREYFEEGRVTDKTLANKIFGEGAQKDSTSSNKGSHIFHQASLLSIPVRSNVKPFFNATCPAILQKFIDDAELFDIDIKNIKQEIEDLLKGVNANSNPDIINFPVQDLKIEDYSNFNQRSNKNIPNLCKVFGENLVIFVDNDFSDLCSDYNLPVIARNNLENGQSKNLWYEQIVPRQSRFYFFTAYPNDPDLFDTNVNGEIVQIGANSSIGYGVCLVNNLKTQLL